MRCNPPPNEKGQIPQDKFTRIQDLAQVDISRKLASAKALSLSLWVCLPFKVRVAFSVLKAPKILPRPRLHIGKVLFGVAIAIVGMNKTYCGRRSIVKALRTRFWGALRPTNAPQTGQSGLTGLEKPRLHETRHTHWVRTLCVC